jgi:hypothetical protein
MQIIKSNPEEGTNCVVVSYSEEEQRRDGVKPFEAMFWSPEDPDELAAFGHHGARFDSLEEACEFLDMFDWNFDSYDFGEGLMALGYLKEHRRENAT